VKKLVWLASYPKSGNTWLRVFLTNYLRNDGQPADINALDMQANAADRRLVDNALVVECSDLTEEELAWYRPEAYRILARRSQQTLHLKIHDAYTRSGTGEALIPAEVTLGAVYLVRNPLDVSTSFAHHYSLTVDAAIARMGSEDGALACHGPRLRPQLKQQLLTWSGHVASWVDQTDIPVHLVRYEDMLRQPAQTFGAAIRFLDIPYDADRVRTAVAFSSFRHLRDQEQARGFKEKAPGAESFFRAGRAGSWRRFLTEAQIARIIGDHGAVMRRLGYLAEDGLPPDDIV
jgi:aryl sulfotransferase